MTTATMTPALTATTPDKRAVTTEPRESKEPRAGVRQVNVRMSAELFAELEEAARLDHRSFSSAVAIAVARWARCIREQHRDARAAPDA